MGVQPQFAHLEKKIVLPFPLLASVWSPRTRRFPIIKTPAIPPPTPKAKAKAGNALGHSKGTESRHEGVGSSPHTVSGKARGWGASDKSSKANEGASSPSRAGREHAGVHKGISAGPRPGRSGADDPPRLLPRRPRESPPRRSAPWSGAGSAPPRVGLGPAWPRDTRTHLGLLGHYPRPPNRFLYLGWRWLSARAGLPLRDTWLETGQGPEPRVQGIPSELWGFIQ